MAMSSLTYILGFSVGSRGHYWGRDWRKVGSMAISRHHVCILFDIVENKCFSRFFI
jgi:hypothetical protein